MSGGVDSSVAAALLKKAGYAVRGFFMALAQPDIDRQVAGVQRIAARLAVPLEVVYLERDFAEEVLDYFTAGYLAGRTPNPCIICNLKIKFGRLMDMIMERGADLMATGHYARIGQGAGGSFQLLKGRDPQKDQSYFLCRLSQARIARLRLPLGEYTKVEVYRMATELGLAGLYGAESQDVCFLKDRGVEDFLAIRHGGIAAGRLGGAIITADGRILGHHNGIHGFTVGQRRGLGIPDATPYYVIGIIPHENKVIVGKKEDLYQRRLIIGNINWINGAAPDLPQNFTVKIRYRHQGAAALVTAADADRLLVHFKEPQRAITPGQFAVLYQDDAMIGGGEIM